MLMQIVLLLILMQSLTGPSLQSEPLPEKGTFKKHKSFKAKAVDSLRNLTTKWTVLTDHADGFLNTPSLAKVRSDDKFDYYLLGVRCNIPMLKPGMPSWYKFIRLEGQVKMKNNSGDSGVTPRILSIYPTNSAITVNVQDLSLLEATVSPQWNGAAVGSLHGEDQKTSTYSYQVPIVTGLSTEDGWVRWSWYASKQQRVLFGNRSLFMLVQVPKNTDRHTLVFDAHLRYATNLSLPLMTAKYDRSCSIDTKMATPLDQMLQSHELEIGKNLVDGITNVFQPKETKEAQ